MVFIKRNKDTDSADVTIQTQFGPPKKKGLVGLEIECEAATANTLPKENPVAGWHYHHDGSLRGVDNAEYVLAAPIDFDKVDPAVDALWEVFKGRKVKLVESLRTSVHVHLNVQQFYQNRLAALLSIWFICEEVLSVYCGDHRAGNLFCVRAKDGHGVITAIREWFATRGMGGFDTENFHYSALNFAALYKFGSLEVRTMRGLTEAAPVKNWVSILKKIYDASEKYTTPHNLIEEFSMQGPMEFFHNVFGEHAQEIIRTVQTELNVSMSLQEGMRFAQDIAYSRDWSDFNPKEVKEDPFGRRPAEFLQAAQAGPGLPDERPPATFRDMNQAIRRGEPVTTNTVAGLAEMPRGARLFQADPFVRRTNTTNTRTRNDEAQG